MVRLIKTKLQQLMILQHKVVLTALNGSNYGTATCWYSKRLLFLSVLLLFLIVAALCL